MLSGRETILRDGKVVGYLTSGGWGYTVGKNIGLGYVRNADGVDDDFLNGGRYELEVATVRVPAALHMGPLYDPTQRAGEGVIEMGALAWMEHATPNLPLEGRSKFAERSDGEFREGVINLEWKRPPPEMPSAFRPPLKGEVGRRNLLP